MNQEEADQDVADEVSEEVDSRDLYPSLWLAFGSRAFSQRPNHYDVLSWSIVSFSPHDW